MSKKSHCLKFLSYSHFNVNFVYLNCSIFDQQQDPLSHRIIEKRRRDRMNSCLADLSRLIPPQFQRKGRGRIEKTEIIEMSIRYMKQLQNQECLHKENVYKMGYEECLQQAANFLYTQHRELCYQLMDHLKEHSNDMILKCKFIVFNKINKLKKIHTQNIIIFQKC